jgi:5-methylcytosine-specific restriction protein B
MTDHPASPHPAHQTKYPGADRAAILPGANRSPDLSFDEAAEKFDRAAIRASVEAAESERLEIVTRFPIEDWSSMALERYALGTPTSADSFCRWMEFRTPNIASIKGGSALKHMIYRRKDDGTWYFEKKYGSVEEAWQSVRGGFVDALQLASQGRWEEIGQLTSISAAIALSTKTVYCYFPEELLPVCSGSHQDHFWKLLGGEGSVNHGVPAARRLLELVRRHSVVDDWKPSEIMWFLYSWADPRQGQRIVKIAPGPNAQVWDDCYANGYIRVGWDDVGDLSQFETRAQFDAKFADAFSGLYKGNGAKIAEKAKEVWTLTELVPGDVVIANRGTGHVVGIGRVNDRRYEWRPELGEFGHTVGVDWDANQDRDIEPIKRWAFKTVAPVSQAEYLQILKGRDTQKGQAERQPHPTSASTVVEPLLREIGSELERKGQVILYGPPGTGKTYNARRFAVWWLAQRLKEPNADKLLNNNAAFRLAEEALASASSDRRVWWVTANAKEWSWNQLFVDGSVDYRFGRLRKNYANIRVGDLVVGYQSNPTKRILAIGRITQTLHPTDEDEQFTIEPVQQVNDGPTWEEILDDGRLKSSEPIRNRSQGTLFALTTAEATYLLSWLKERDPALVDLTDEEGDGVGHLTRVTFHPSYTYEDFVEGFKPQAMGTGALELEMTDGVFKRVCAAARLKPNEPFLLLIDEINRGNIPKIFGELITLLERDKRGLTVTLPQSRETFEIPSNVYVLGTMNTADRSIRLLDAALRRRFAFIELMPETSLLSGATVGDLDLALFLETLNERIAKIEGREKQIGHSFLLDESGQPISDVDVFAAQFRHEIVPLLQEYAFEDYAELESYLGKAVVDVDAQRIRPGLLDDAQALLDALSSSFTQAVAQPETESA